MKKRLIMGSLMICCMALVTAVGFAFTRKRGEEKPPNVFSVSEHYNMKIHDKKTEYKHTEPYTDLLCKNEDLNGKPGDHLQALIMAQVFIVKAIVENPVIISR
jgi:hypothetical protein